MSLCDKYQTCSCFLVPCVGETYVEAMVETVCTSTHSFSSFGDPHSIFLMFMWSVWDHLQEGKGKIASCKDSFHLVCQIMCKYHYRALFN